MANRYRNLIYSTAEYTHSYSAFRGVELNASSTVTSPSRLCYAQNMYKDYDGDGANVIESIPGFRCFAHYGKSIHALYYQRSPLGGEDHLLVHVGDKIMRHPISDIYLTGASGEQIATVCDAKSFGFEYGRYFYIMDTQKIYQISDDGVCKTVGDAGSAPYVPTTYVSGEAYEQRNLLSDGFKEEYYVADPKAYLFSTKGLKISVTDPNLRLCSITGIGEVGESEIYIPAYVEISGISYKVMSIDAEAFRENTYIKSVYLPNGITAVGTRAFIGCTSLEAVYTSSTLTSIEDAAFSGCTALKTLYLGASLKHVGTDAFKGCSALLTINYALGESELKEIDGYGIISARTLSYNSRYEAVKIALPFHDDVDSVQSVTVDDKSVSWETNIDGEHILSFSLSFQSLADATGIKVTATGKLTALGEGWSDEMNALASATPYVAIVGCTVAEVFDGRIFLSGNPKFPNTVFYTERPKQGQDNALYVGIYNYFNDGVGSYKVRSMLAVRDMIAIFKEGDDGSGSIFYHKREGVNLGAIDTIYPVAYVHSGICSSGMCLSFLDDPVFLTGEGLMALNQENINYQRNVVCRSHNVNYSLLKEDLSKACLCEWLGYLVIGTEGKIFLADSRAVFTHHVGSREYEWFLLTDIGAYNQDTKVYRYSSDPYLDTVIHPTLVSSIADSKSVYSATDESGHTYYYTVDGGIKYSVVPTEELTGGDFCPGTIFISHEKLLLFATDDGHLCVFNNDMRGIAPDSVKSSSGYDAEKYALTMGNRLHPLFYSFAGHAPKYEIRTALDDCGVPHLTKSTTKKSLVVKARSTSPDAICCKVKTDERDPVYVGRFPAVSAGFESFDFTLTPWYTSRYTSVSLNENEKRWIEKQIVLSADSFASPISIYSVSYRYTIKGKIKNNV